jgi:hypothetical protein
MKLKKEETTEAHFWFRKRRSTFHMITFLLKHIEEPNKVLAKLGRTEGQYMHSPGLIGIFLIFSYVQTDNNISTSQDINQTYEALQRESLRPLLFIITAMGVV